MPYRRDTGVASVITDSPLLLAALSSGDRHTLAGPVLRAATLISDLQPAAQYRDVAAAVEHLAQADDIDQAMAELITNPATTQPVREVVRTILTAAEQRAARWSR